MSGSIGFPSFLGEIFSKSGGSYNFFFLVFHLYFGRIYCRFSCRSSFWFSLMALPFPRQGTHTRTWEGPCWKACDNWDLRWEFSHRSGGWNRDFTIKHRDFMVFHLKNWIFHNFTMKIGIESMKRRDFTVKNRDVTTTNGDFSMNHTNFTMK